MVQTLKNDAKIRYLGVTAACDLKWKTHACNISTKASRAVGFLGPQDLTESAFKGFVRLVMKYGSLVWDTQGFALN